MVHHERTCSPCQEVGTTTIQRPLTLDQRLRLLYFTFSVTTQKGQLASIWGLKQGSCWSRCRSHFNLIHHACLANLCAQCLSPSGRPSPHVFRCRTTNHTHIAPNGPAVSQAAPGIFGAPSSPFDGAVTFSVRIRSCIATCE